MKTAKSLNQPTISVLTPTWNRGIKMLNRCITCVNWQSFKDWEHVIVSDGQDPSLREYFKHTLKDEPRRHFHELDENHNDYGASVRRLAMPMLKGKYFAFLDDDNIIHPELYSILPSLEDNKMYTFNQIRSPDVFPFTDFLKGNKPEVFHIDSAMLLIDYPLCKDIRWQNHTYFSDGLFIMECYSKHKEKWIYIDKTLAYYNKL